MKVSSTLLFVTAVFVSLNALPLGGEDVDLAEKVRLIVEKIIGYTPEKFEIKNVNIKIPANILISGEFNISEISLSGLKNLDIDGLTYHDTERRLDYAFNFKDIITVVETHLSLIGPVQLDHPLSIHVDFKDFKTEGYAVVAEDKKSVEDLKILVTLGESDFEIKGLVNDDELSEDVSKFLTENVAKAIDEIGPVFSPIASEIVRAIINYILKIVD